MLGVLPPTIFFSLEDTLISWSNQTSYMSICLRDQDYRLDCPVDQLSMEELKKKFVEVLGVVKEMHWVIQELKKKPFDFSTSDPSGNEKQKSLDTSEASLCFPSFSFFKALLVCTCVISLGFL
ncbi:PREDICTED: CDK5 regulatory subunit-associated protein 2-like isoform X2 [Thamnophis sirtalis]|uniref:CDK5 regulatory subunit-associated protein 2-like isoform X2 n=1 Tax=Thamnophis sirtalis TaxID=35019 RepID=A0A6I9XX98_9SAUR|nr:PREDICTED: CDK5 regulatory subunit-associated protein 2-like isoform X2 [Thamnophis sirtalis]